MSWYWWSIWPTFSSLITLPIILADLQKSLSKRRYLCAHLIVGCPKVLVCVQLVVLAMYSFRLPMKQLTLCRCLKYLAMVLSKVSYWPWLRISPLTKIWVNNLPVCKWCWRLIISLFDQTHFVSHVHAHVTLRVYDYFSPHGHRCGSHAIYDGWFDRFIKHKKTHQC
jgi:hypothetical protein